MKKSIKKAANLMRNVFLDFIYMNILKSSAILFQCRLLKICFFTSQKTNESSASIFECKQMCKICAKKQGWRLLILGSACVFLYLALNVGSLTFQSAFWAFFVSIVSWVVLVKRREYKNNQIIANMLMNEYDAIKEYMIKTILFSKGGMYSPEDIEHLLDHRNFSDLTYNHGLMDDFSDYISPGSVYYNDFYQRFRKFHDVATYAKNNYVFSSKHEIVIINVFCNFIYRIERTNPDCSYDDDKMIDKFVFEILAQSNHVTGPRNYDINEFRIKCLLI